MLFGKIRRIALAVSATVVFAPTSIAQSTSSSVSTAPPPDTTSISTTPSVSSATTSSSSTSSSSPSATPHAQSVFVSPSGDLAFGITIPQDSNTDIYFTIAAPTGVSWAAVGLGSNKMKGSLVLMIYASGSSNNVTFSPRLAVGNYEPAYYPRQVETLNTTGIVNDTFVYAGRCSNCRNWQGGYIDVTSTSQNCIFATGPDGWISSDDPAAWIKYHQNYGAFTINMKAATGPAGAPIIGSATSTSSGATVGAYETDKRDWGAALHALVMVGCFVILLPFGVLVLRSGGMVRSHGINQGLAAVGVLIGAGLGVFVSFYYNRSRGFTNPHQLIGLVVSVFMVVQFSVGFTHHRIYKRTQRTTRLATIHVWLGRVLLILGIVNAFLGFPFSLNPQTDYFLGGLVFVAAVVFLAALYMRRRFPGWNIPGRGPAARLRQSAGYAPEPFRSADVPAYGGANTAYGGAGAAPPYNVEEEGVTEPREDIGLADLSPADAPRGKDGGREGRRLVGGASGSAIDLGAEHTPREYV